MGEDVIVVTGGHGGIGSKVIRKYLNNNTKVIVLDIKPSKDLIQDKNYQYIKTDVTNAEEIICAKDIIEKDYGAITHIISMAGINQKSEIGGIEGMELSDIDLSITLNLNAHLYITKIMLPLIKKSEANNKSITMISSINAIKPFGLPAYSAAKSGIYGLMNSITKELGQYDIKINTISLGTVLHGGENLEESYFENYKKMLAIKKFVTSDDVAELIYCITQKIYGITGQNIILDNGQSL